jgi:alcohol dehydrogenase (NADP+)
MGWIYPGQSRIFETHLGKGEFMDQAKAYSAASSTSPLACSEIARRGPTEHHAQIEILFLGICRSDLHQVRNEWSGVV